MTPIEYKQKLREAKEISWQEKMDKKADSIREKILSYIVIISLLLGFGTCAKAFADYTVTYFVCSICHSKNDSPSCCYGAHFTEVEYTVEGEPPSWR